MQGKTHSAVAVFLQYDRGGIFNTLTPVMFIDRQLNHVNFISLSLTESLCQELDQERKARFTLQQKLKGALSQLFGARITR